MLEYFEITHKFRAEIILKYLARISYGVMVGYFLYRNIMNGDLLFLMIMTAIIAGSISGMTVCIMKEKHKEKSVFVWLLNNKVYSVRTARVLLISWWSLLSVLPVLAIGLLDSGIVLSQFISICLPFYVTYTYTQEFLMDFERNLIRKKYKDAHQIVERFDGLVDDFAQGSEATKLKFYTLLKEEYDLAKVYGMREDGLRRLKKVEKCLYKGITERKSMLLGWTDDVKKNADAAYRVYSDRLDEAVDELTADMRQYI